MVDHIQPGGKEQQWGLCNNTVFILKECSFRKRFLPIGPWPFSRQRDRRCTFGSAVVQHNNQIHRRTLEASPVVVLLHVVVLYPVSHSFPTSIRAVHFRRTVFGILIKCVIYILLQRKKKKQPTGFGWLTCFFFLGFKNEPRVVYWSEVAAGER